MFFFEAIPWYSWIAWIGLLVGLMLVNEISRHSKNLSIAVYVVLPILLTIFVWPKTSGPGTGVHTANWFAWVKVYSALAGCIAFMGLRYSEKIRAKKWFYTLPAAILALNIAEAVVREFQVRGMQGVTDGMFFMGGPWNILNGIAGIFNLLAICGWFGIIISKDNKKDMIWPDMMWFWIIGYDLWNFAYVYNCNTDRAFFSGFALLLSCTIPAFFIKKGAWLQFRGQTLAVFMMLMLAIPNFFVEGKYAVASSHNPTAYYTISIISFAANLALAIYQVNTIMKKKKNPLKDELYTDHKSYQEIKAANS
jgi:hypothetical protein